MPRGGKRTGTPGKAYQNRTDLDRPAVAVSTPTYGDQAQQQRAVQAVPLPTAPPPSPPAPAGPFDRPSDRPAEPLTAGLPVGAGPGPSLNMPVVNTVAEGLRAAFRAAPNPAIEELLERFEGR